MQNAGERSKALVVRLGVLANKLTFYRYGVPKSVVAELVALEKDMRADKVLRKKGPFYFEVLNDLLAYVDAKNAGKKALADAHMSKAIARWSVIDAALMEVKASGV